MMPRARQATGTFQFPDPVFETGSPQQHNRYSYAAGNPGTNSDPTGLCDHPSDPDPFCYKTQSGNPDSAR